MPSSPAVAALSSACPDDWVVLPLADVAYFQEGPGILAKDFREFGVPLLRLKCVEGDYVTLDGCNYLDPDMVARRWSHFRVDIGDLLISTSASLGRVSVVTSQSAGGVPYTGLIRFKPKDKRLLSGYLKAFLGSAAFIEQAESMASGSVIRHFGPSHIRQMAILVPPLGQQLSIGEVASILDERLRLLRQTNATLEAIAQALFKSWFIDFDPVRAKAEGREPESMDAATAALFPAEFEDSPLGLIPKGWAAARLGDLLSNLYTGRRPKGGVAHFIEGVPSIGAESIAGIGVFDYGKVKYVPEEFYASLRSGKPNDFDILLYKDGGKPGHFMPRLGMFGCGFPFDKYCINEHVFGIRCAEDVGQPYGYFWIRQERMLDLLRGLGNKAAIPGINRGDIEGLPILVPHRMLTAAFNAQALLIIKRMLLNSTVACRLSELRDTLLPRLISGKLRLPEARAQVEEAVA